MCIDILNDERYREHLDLFRKRCRQEHAATEIAYITRGMNGEPHLLELCHPDNVRLIAELLRRFNLDDVIANLKKYDVNGHVQACVRSGLCISKEVICIVVMESGMLSKVRTFIRDGDYSRVAGTAERAYREEIKRVEPEISDDDLGAVTDNGYYESPNKKTEIYLYWSSAELDPTGDANE